MSEAVELATKARVTRDAVRAVARRVNERDGPTRLVRYLHAVAGMMADDDARYLRRLIR